MTSHSSTLAFNTCPERYRNSKVLGLTKEEVGAESNDMVWGVAAHEVFKCHYGYNGTEEECCEVFERFYPTDLDPSDVVKTREGGMRTIAAYLEYYKEKDKEWEILEVENTGEEDSLRIDLVARQKSSGSIYFWDHKTVSKLNSYTTDRYEMDAQISRYTLHVRQKYGDCAGAIINLICPQFFERKWKDRPAGWSFKFDRPVIIHSQEILDQWQASQEKWEHLIEYCKKEYGIDQQWPMHLGWQCGRCEFNDKCKSAGGMEWMYVQKEVRNAKTD